MRARRARVLLLSTLFSMLSAAPKFPDLPLMRMDRTGAYPGEPDNGAAAAICGRNVTCNAVLLRALIIGDFPQGCLWECTSECSGQARRLIFVICHTLTP